jgi:hypothetical protein
MIKRCDGWLAARVGDEIVMMSAKEGTYLGLNEVGACVWDLLEAPRGLAELCEGVAVEFETTPDACRPDVEAFLTAMEACGAVQTVAV